MDYPFNLFKTKESISYKKLENTENIFSTISKSVPKSILNSYKLEILNNFKKNNINENQKFNILDNLSNIYNDLLINKKNIIDFFKILIDYKNDISLNIEYINKFKMFTKNNINNFNKFNIKTNIEDLYFYNPINYSNIEKGFLNEKIMNEIINKYIYENKEEVDIVLDILEIGDIINISLPSIGIIKSVNSSKTNDYIKFVESIIKENSKECNKIKIENPLITLKLGNKISDILLNISKNVLLNNINNLNFNNTFNKLISNKINNININFENIFFNNKKIKNEFIIPYTFNNKTEDIEESNKSSIEKIKDIASLFKSNNEIVIFVLEKIMKDKELIEKKNYKNVLACYLYYIINIIYKVIYEYIDQIDLILKNFINSKNKRFKILNIEGAFDYTGLLKKSLLKFKLILLNNFYNLFIPNNIENGNYGMKLNENNCYIPESEFINENENIINNYPFIYNDISGELSVEQLKLKIFISSIKNRKDIYDKLDLEFGGIVFNTIIDKKAIKILIDYYSILQKNNKFNLYIIEKIIYYFNVSKSIPYELIDFMEIDIKDYKNNKNKVERNLLNNYEKYIEKSSINFMKYIQIKNKINISKKIDIHNLLNIQQKYLLYYNTYYTIGSCIYIITDKYISDFKLKISIIKKFNQIKTQYENKIQEYLEK